LFYVSSFCVLCPLLIVSLDYPLDDKQYVYYTIENTVTVISDFTLTVNLVKEETPRYKISWYCNR
jgi:hypothetical protein